MEAVGYGQFACLEPGDDLLPAFGFKLGEVEAFGKFVVCMMILRWAGAEKLDVVLLKEELFE